MIATTYTISELSIYGVIYFSSSSVDPSERGGSLDLDALVSTGPLGSLDLLRHRQSSILLL